MKKYLLYCLVPAYLSCWIDETRFKVGFGPSWFASQTDERFTATSDGAPGALQMNTQTNLGPWVDGTFNAKFCRHGLIEAYVGGGWVRKGYAKQLTKVLSINFASVSKYFDLDADLSGDMLLTYVGAGPYFEIRDNYTLSVTGGFAFNRQKWGYCMLARPESAFVKDSWTAGYIGLDSYLGICDCFAVDFYYKGLIGKAKSHMVQTSGGVTKPDYRSYPLFFGNIFSLTGEYSISDCTKTGITALYTYLQNMKSGCCITPVNSSVRNNYLARMRYTMLAITGFIEFRY